MAAKGPRSCCGFLAQMWRQRGGVTLKGSSEEVVAWWLLFSFLLYLLPMPTYSPHIDPAEEEVRVLEMKVYEGHSQEEQSSALFPSLSPSLFPITSQFHCITASFPKAYKHALISPTSEKKTQALLFILLIQPATALFPAHFCSKTHGKCCLYLLSLVHLLPLPISSLQSGMWPIAPLKQLLSRLWMTSTIAKCHGSEPHLTCPIRALTRSFYFFILSSLGAKTSMVTDVN